MANGTTSQLSSSAPKARSAHRVKPKEAVIANRYRDDNQNHRAAKKARTNATLQSIVPVTAQPKPLGFMDLPPEIRNMIYKACLIDPSGCLTIVEVTREHRHVATYVQHSSGASYQSVPHRGASHRNRKNPLSPQILRLSKQIKDESLPMLYGQKIEFWCSTSIHCFFSQIGQTNAELIREVALRNFSFFRNHLSQNLPNFNCLAGAKNITKLYISGIRALSCKLPELVEVKHFTQRLYADCWWWLESIGKAQGDKFAGLDVVVFDPELFCIGVMREHDAYDKLAKLPRSAMQARAMEKFNSEMRELVCVGLPDV